MVFGPHQGGPVGGGRFPGQTGRFPPAVGEDDHGPVRILGRSEDPQPCAQ
jgi:hypothetical protein